MTESSDWPPLPLAAWADTYATLHRWTQVLGKVCLARTVRTNHFWNIAFRPGARGLETPVLSADGRSLALRFDFCSHRLVFHRSDGRREEIPLEPQTVASFYARTMDALRRLGFDTRIWTTPVEIPVDAIPFEKDESHRAYDAGSVSAFWRAVLAMRPVFEAFRARFLGKCSPVHFFWGSFDLAVTRFSGRRAPERPGADPVTREAYSHEVISHGFWPGGGAVGEPAFYAYAAPEPADLKIASIAPAAASYSGDLSEFLLPYDAVRRAGDPARELTRFLESTYERAADLAGWDRASLERR